MSDIFRDCHLNQRLFFVGNLRTQHVAEERDLTSRVSQREQKITEKSSFLPQETQVVILSW